jgi:hypothetical protein
MQVVKKLPQLVILGMLVVGCGEPSGPQARSSPAVIASPSLSSSSVSPLPWLSPSPSATPPAATTPTSSSATFLLLPTVLAPEPESFTTVTCTGSIGPSDPVGVGILSTTVLVLYGYADATNPRTVCQMGGPWPVQLIDAHHMLVEGTSAPKHDLIYAVVDLPEVRYHWFQLPDPKNQLQFPAVGPGLDRIVWASKDPARNVDDVHLTTSAGDNVVASIPNAHLGGMGGVDARFTNSGSYIWFSDDFGSADSLLVLDDSQTPQAVFSLNGGRVPIWSPTTETLYYIDNGDVWRWTAADGARIFLSGVNAITVTISADGRYLAYDSHSAADSVNYSYLVDLVKGDGPKQLGNGGRGGGVFLNSTLLSYATEAHTRLVCDVSTGTESPSAIMPSGISWPAASSR